MSLENFKNRKIEWDTVNKNFDRSVQIVSGDVNSRTVTIVITDNGEPINLTGYSVKLVYKYVYNDSSGFVMLEPTDAPNGEFSLTIPTEMTSPGSIKSNLILLNENLEQVIVSKSIKFISDDSTVTDLAQEVNSKIDDFTKLLLENMPQVMRSELNDLHAQTESNTSNIDLKANSSDMTSLQSAMNSLQNKVEAFGITPDNLITIKSLLDAIANNAADSEVAELINSVNVLTNNISLMSGGDYSPKANKTDLESLQSVVNTQSANISSKASQTDLDNLKTDVTSQGVAISTKAEQAGLLITNQNVETAQTTANQAKTDAQTAMTKATEAQAKSLPLTGNAVSSSKLATARKLGVSLQASAFQNFDGTVDVNNIGVQGVLPIANGGTGTNDGVINTIAYANSADGANGFTTVYPNLNLLNGTRDFSGTWTNSDIWETDGTYKGLIVKKRTAQWGGIYKTFTAPKDGVYSFSTYIKASGTTTIINRYGVVNGVIRSERIKYTAFDWLIDSLSVTLQAGQTAYFRYELFTSNTDAILWTAGHKWEEGATATPYMPSSSEVAIADYPKYVGFSNIIKPNKTYSDYKWLPMGLVSIDSATGLLKPAVMGIDYAQAHPVGSVISNSSNTSSGYTTGTWQNIGSAVIGSTTVYYWKRTA